jgi:triacylglycerol lipase
MTTFNLNASTTRYEPETAFWLAKAAQLAYEDEPSIKAQAEAWGFDRVRFFSKRETQAFTMGNDRAIVTAFRGTEKDKIIDWMTDIDIELIPAPGGRVHAGFFRALTYVYPELRAAIAEFQTQGQSLWFTGHSLGGSLATLAVAKLRFEEDKPIYGLYTFGQARTGDREFERNFNLDFKSRTFRFVNNNDVIPRVPPRSLGYSHVGTFLYFDTDGNLHGDIAWWYRLLDGISGRIDDFLKPGADGIKDHDLGRYIAHLEKNLNLDRKLLLELRSI